VCFVCGSLAAVLCALALLHNYNYPLKYTNEIESYSKLYQLDAALVASMISAESRFKAKAVSHRGAVGLMQIMPGTAKYMAEYWGEPRPDAEQLFIPEVNIKFGCLYLRYLFDRFDDVWVVVAAYNAGPTNAAVWLKDARFSSDGNVLRTTPFTETNAYVEKVKGKLPYYNKKFV